MGVQGAECRVTVRPGRSSASRRGLARSRDAVAALELALIMPVLLLVSFGFIATNALFYTWAQMENTSYFAASMMANGQILNWCGTAPGPNTGACASGVTCASSPASTTAEYYACSGLPSWGTYTVKAAECCSASCSGIATTNPSVVVIISATNAALGDVQKLFTSQTLSTQTAMMKQGTCP